MATQDIDVFEDADADTGVASRIESFLKNIGRGREDPQWKVDLREQVARGEADPALLTMGIDPLDKAGMLEAAYGPGASPTQTLWGAGLFSGLGGIADVFGFYPVPQSRNASIYEMVTGPKSLSANQNLEAGHPVIAGLQTMGAAFPGLAVVKAGAKPLQKGVGALSRSNADEALKAIENVAADKGIKLDIFEKDGVIDLSRIVVPEKGQGVGSEMMRQIIDYADQTGQTIKLTPSKDFGASSVGRLKEFYKKFGFVENKGRNKTFEFRDSMYRPPVALRAGESLSEATDRLRMAYDAAPSSAKAKKAYLEMRSARDAAGETGGTAVDTGIGSLDVDTSYRMSHQPSPRDAEAIQLDNLSQDISGSQGGYPDDFYSSEGQRLYAQGPRFAGDEYGIANEQSYKAIIEAKGNPEAEVTIYRAVPEGIGTINQGDFVTLSPKYAELHAASGYGRGGDEAGEVISQKVKVKDLLWAGDDVNEFGYAPAPVDEIDATKYAEGGEVTDQNVQRFKELLKKVGINKMYEAAASLGFRLPTGIGRDSAADVITNELLFRANIPLQKRGDDFILEKQLRNGLNLGLDFNPEQKYGYINVSGTFKADGGEVNSVGIGRLSR